MAASRKLQQEIERTIKRINEGCDEFDQIWDKVGLECRVEARERGRSRERMREGPASFSSMASKASVVVLLFSRGFAPFQNSACSFLPQLRDRRPSYIDERWCFGQEKPEQERNGAGSGLTIEKRKAAISQSLSPPSAAAVSSFLSHSHPPFFPPLSTTPSLWSQVYDPDQAALKEKNEADLKKELKKLQKCRDQIKNWISGNEVKDKTDLLAARRAVERQMERFKVCERESKTKTFSKEGLSLQATKVDPAQARRNDARDWITATVSTLEEECEAFEAEVESLGGGSGGGGGGDSKGGGGRRGKAKAIPPRVTHLEASAERHRAHVARLEQLLRLLDNEAVEVEDVEGVRELVDDYLARNQGGSEEAADRASATMTPDEFAEPDDLYEGLLERLDAVEAALPLVPSAVALKAHKGDDGKGGIWRRRRRGRRT